MLVTKAIDVSNLICRIDDFNIRGINHLFSDIQVLNVKDRTVTISNDDKSQTLSLDDENIHIELRVASF